MDSHAHRTVSLKAMAFQPYVCSNLFSLSQSCSYLGIKHEICQIDTF